MEDLPPFETELYFVDYEFCSPHNLAASDCETVSISELMELASASFEDFGRLRLGYTESYGHPDLRARIASRYENVVADDVMILGSPIEGIYLLSQVIRGETVVLIPAYDALKNLPNNLKLWPLKTVEGDWSLDFDALGELVTSETELLVVNFPHNPTGFVPSVDDWNKLVSFCREHSIRLFCDEIYAGLYRPDTEEISSAVEELDDAIVLGGLSKAQGLPGLRSGWLITRDPEMRKKLHDVKLYTTMCPPAPVEFFCDIALRCEKQLVQRSNDIIEKNLRIAEAFFARHSDLFGWRKPRGASIALVELFGQESAEKWCRELVEERGIVLLPGVFLGFPDRFVRFGFGRQSFAEDLKALDKALS